MKTTNRFRIVTTWGYDGEEYNIQELYTSRNKKRSKWMTWVTQGFECTSSWPTPYKTIKEAEEAIDKEMERRKFVPKIIKEL